MRDGDQADGAVLCPNDELELALQLERLKVDIIEVGFPAASETDLADVPKIAGVIKCCVVSAFARGKSRDIEFAGATVSKASSPRIGVAVPVSDIHVIR